MKRFNVAGTHVGDRKDADFHIQVRSFSVAKQIADKLNELEEDCKDSSFLTAKNIAEYTVSEALEHEIDAVESVIKTYASKKCEEQRKLIIKKFKKEFCHTTLFNISTVEDIILNSPQPIFK